MPTRSDENDMQIEIQNQLVNKNPPGLIILADVLREKIAVDGGKKGPIRISWCPSPLVS